MAGNLRIAVPNALNLITSYVLSEQEDWFEDEIGFVRRLLLPGDRILDIGANYGTYTLSMARIVGEAGHVWAFEPASSTASYLARSIDLNDMKNVTLTQAALSDHAGHARLGLNANSELNSLQQGSGDSDSEEVPLRTLDQCRRDYGWQGIGFIKLDAEGEESNILKGGTDFLRDESPLVMFELKHGTAVNVRLIEDFARLGYDSYRLVPGLNLLAPYSLQEAPDPYQLNLFSCKPGRAAELAARGLLVTSCSAAALPPVPPMWRERMSGLPYAAALTGRWRTVLASRATDAHTQACLRGIELYLLAHGADRPEVRCRALQESFNILFELCKQAVTISRLSSLARVAWEYGQRGLAVGALGHAVGMIGPDGVIPLDEPFLAASPRFDQVDPAGRLDDWMFAALLEQLEKLQSYSSYYTGRDTLPRLQVLQKLGFQSEEMNRRVKLIQARFPA